MFDNKMEYDIFLGGPWERHAPFRYKSIIKEAFSDRNIFDPEERPSQERGDWFADNFYALEHSRAMVALVPSFPFPGVAPEVGIFYYSKCNNNPTKALDEIIIIWPPIVKPDYGKKVAEKMGYIVESSDEAILRLKSLLSK